MDEDLLRRWHSLVNAADTAAVVDVVTDPVVVSGPRGAGRISAVEFAEWVRRSGISLEPRGWHEVSDRVAVVEQHATWPQDTQGTGVATCFVTSEGRVSAALRYPSVEEALRVGALLSEVLAAEASGRSEGPANDHGREPA